MKNARQVLWGIIIALVSIIFILGGVVLSLAEGNSQAHSATQTPSPTQTLWVPSTETPTPIVVAFLPSVTDTLPAAAPLSPIAPTDTVVQPTTVPGTASSTPPSNAAASTPTNTRPPASATRAATTCGAPANWVTYTVKPGDTLYKLSYRYGVTVEGLEQANCLGGSTLLQVGQKLRVPPVQPPPPTSPAATSTPLPPSATPYTPLPTSLP